MQIRAKVISKLPIASGTSQSGNSWSKATLIAETFGQYPKKIAMSNMKKAAEFDAIPIGATATFEIDIESREYNGRWYTEVNCWNWNVEAPGAPYPQYPQP